MLVAVDGSEGSEKALDCAISICQAVDATLTALAVEGKLPAYAASLGEVDEARAAVGDVSRPHAPGKPSGLGSTVRLGA